MNPRARRILTAIALGVVTWVLLAAFLRMQRAHGDEGQTLAVGAAMFLAYVVTVGYVMHFRWHWSKPRANDRPRRLGPMARWMLTIVGIGGLSLAGIAAFPRLIETYEGQLLLFSLVFAGIGFGLVATTAASIPARKQAAAHEPHAAPAQEPPSFPRSAFKLIAGAGGMAAIIVVLFGPGILVVHQLHERVDIPACQRTCAAHGDTFEGLRTGKSMYDCMCIGPRGRHVFHDRANIGGGRGLGWGLLDFLIRAVAVLGTEIVWIVALVVGLGRLDQRVGRRRLFRRGRG